MGCACFKSKDSKELSNIKKLGFYKFRSHKNGNKSCYCFNCFNCFKKKPELEEEENDKEENDKELDGIDLVRVTLPSVKINDLETPIEKLRKSFSGVYMRDKGLNTFINNSYIANEKPEENSSIDNDEKPKHDNVIDKNNNNTDENTKNTDNIPVK